MDRRAKRALERLGRSVAHVAVATTLAWMSGPSVAAVVPSAYQPLVGIVAIPLVASLERWLRDGSYPDAEREPSS